MKATFIFLSFLLITEPSPWLSDFERAKEIAHESNHLILLNFSGSDWCAPCIRMKRELFSQDVFTKYTSENLILVQADFPRSKKLQPNALQKKKNEALAEKYNPQGKFPYTLLLSDSGEVIHTWEGYSTMTAEDFVNQLKNYSLAQKH